MSGSVPGTGSAGGISPTAIAVGLFLDHLATFGIVEIASSAWLLPAVLEAAVVGRKDDQKLVKPQAFVVLKEPGARSAALADELEVFVKAKLAPYKYPRWVEFREELPKTGTGKIQRFKLRGA